MMLLPTGPTPLGVYAALRAHAARAGTTRQRLPGGGGLSEAEQMRAAWRLPGVPALLEIASEARAARRERRAAFDAMALPAASAETTSAVA
jgi:hypothetical protein